MLLEDAQGAQVALHLHWSPEELAQIESGTAGRCRNGYPAELREAVLAHAARRRAERVSQDEVASELDMSPQTLCYWRALAPQRGSIAPVAIVAKREVASEVVVECGPLRVRGLDVGGVAELLRRLE